MPPMKLEQGDAGPETLPANDSVEARKSTCVTDAPPATPGSGMKTREATGDAAPKAKLGVRCAPLNSTGPPQKIASPA